MFKGILPSKRITSSDFTMLTSLSEAKGKENNHPSQPSAKLGKPAPGIGKGHVQSHYRKKTFDAIPQETASPGDMNIAFDQLLEELQIPTTLRPKLAGMDSSVKAAMLKSSQTMALAPKAEATPDPPSTPRIQTPRLRKTRSIDSINNATPAPSTSDFDPMRRLQGSLQHESLIGTPSKPSHHRGRSFDAQRLFSKSQINLLGNGSTVDLSLRSVKEKDSASSKATPPTKMVSFLQGNSSTTLDIENIKKLRLLLRNESASWTEEFLKLGGYNALIVRLNEILEVEWREEQHDDQVLHELLRCFKALSTSAIGCDALRASSPNPFDKLMALLYSDKKPGEVATRQLIAELVMMLFDLYPSQAGTPGQTNVVGSSMLRNARDSRLSFSSSSSSSISSSQSINLPTPHKTFFSFIRALLLTPRPRDVEAPETPLEPHEFIESLHQPRIYKTYLQEACDVCRDYFWVFCHPNNTIWMLSETDEGKVEKPRAPGGMTGGVEFEAMVYFTTHFRLMNAVAKSAADMNYPREHELSSFSFHQDLFRSGLERVILIARKASTTYYPTLHLEISRYMCHAQQAGFELPWTLSRLMGKPPQGLCKQQPSTPNSSRTRTTSNAPRQPTTSGGRAVNIPSRPQTPSGRKTPGPGSPAKRQTGGVPPILSSSPTKGRKLIPVSPQKERRAVEDKPPLLPSPKKGDPFRV